jgi:hypothetical protein
MTSVDMLTEVAIFFSQEALLISLQYFQDPIRRAEQKL